MKEDIKKFMELLRTDTEFQNKLKEAVNSYTGEKTEEAFFNEILVPLGKEYGISASFEELSDYRKELSSDGEAMSTEELKQIAGGDKANGFGITLCIAFGVGLGCVEDEYGGAGCLVVGLGDYGTACYEKGFSTGEIL